MSALTYRWEPWQRQLLKERDDSQTATITWLAAQFRMPRHTVRHKARELGLARTREPAWTEEDLAYLHAPLATMPLTRLARRLGRTVVSVRLKAKRSGITTRTAGGYTARDLSRLLGCDVHAVTRWIDRGWRQARRRHMDKTHAEYGLSHKAVKTCIVRYTQHVDLRTVDRDWCIDVLADPDVRIGKDTP